MLIEHRSWLARADFRVFVDVAASFRDDRVLLASVEWEAVLAANLAASTSETQMLTVVAELAGVHTGRALHDLLGGLDRANTSLVIRAVLHAQYGADALPVTVTSFLRVETNDMLDPSEPSSAGGWAEPEGPTL